MPPGQTIPMDLSYTIAKKVCSAQDFERLACAYLASKEPVNFDADKAAREFGGGKADSFKRQIWVITKRIKDYKGGADEANDEHNNPTTPKSNGSKKRKADAPPTTEKSSAKKGRKARSEEAENVKSEPAASNDSDGEFQFS